MLIPPSLRGAPVIGHYFEFRRNVPHVLMRALGECGEVARIPVAYENVYLVNHLDAIRTILVDRAQDFVRGRSHHELRRLIGDGMLTAEHNSWVGHRRDAQPAFHPKRIAEMSADIEKLTEARLDSIERRTRGGQEIHLANELMELASQIACATLFGLELSADDAREFVAAFLVAQTHAFQRLTNPIQPRSRTADDALRVVTRLAKRIARESGAQALFPQVMTLLATAPENPSNTLAWTIYLLCRHPEVETKLRDSLRTQGSNCDYMRWVVDESIRLYPGAWGFERTTSKCEEIADYSLPKRSLIVIAPYTLHRNRRYWPNSETFIPERFHPDEVALRPRFAYMPFSAGPRKCVGDRFALAVVHQVLPRWLRRFRTTLSANERGEMLPLFTLRPKTGILAHVELV